MTNKDVYQKGVALLEEWEDVNYCEHDFQFKGEWLTDKEVVDCLNELYEENEKLKQDIIQIEKVSYKRYYDNQRLKTRLQEKDSLLQKTLKTNEALQKALQKQYEEFDEK